jgi:geranylgeranyl transferase type-2 subunit beta
MPTPDYLQQLTIQLSAGLGKLPDEVRARHAAYLTSAQRDDGGFAGRQGNSDLYYTGFALRGLAVLGELSGDPAERAAHFLKSRMGGQESIVDFFSLLYSTALLRAAAGIDVLADAPDGWRDAVQNALEKLRRDDGGYAKGADGAASSTYHTFLVLLCMQLIDRPVPEPARIVRFLHSQEAEDGGFREIRASQRAGTNPTAAAVGSLRLLDAVDETRRAATIDFLIDMQTDEGGLRANTRIPIADLLSTFTGAWTLADLGAIDQLDLAAMKPFVESLQWDHGGFQAAAWDVTTDVEYTFYGLGCLALLAECGT